VNEMRRNWRASRKHAKREIGAPRKAERREERQASFASVEGDGKRKGNRREHDSGRLAMSSRQFERWGSESGAVARRKVRPPELVRIRTCLRSWLAMFSAGWLFDVIFVRIFARAIRRKSPRGLSAARKRTSLVCGWRRVIRGMICCGCGRFRCGSVRPGSSKISGSAPRSPSVWR